MKQNMGSADRWIRAMIGIVLVVLFFKHIVTGTAAVIGLAVAGIFLVTAVIGNCPLYSIFGIKTCNTRRSIKV